MACMSFDAVIPGSSVKTYPDQYVDAVELIMVTTGKTKARALQQIKELNPEFFDIRKIRPLKLPGKGNLKTYVTHCNDAVELLMVLPGKMCKKHRIKIANIIIRYLDGDMSMCHQIAENRKMEKARSYAKFANTIINQVQHEEEVGVVGYVYATSSSAFPGLLKIGKAVDVPRRVAQLNTGCAPAPHFVIAVAPSFDYSRDEALAHEYFSAQRREGEFFEVSAGEVKEFFRGIAEIFQAEMAQKICSMVGQTFLTN